MRSLIWRWWAFAKKRQIKDHAKLTSYTVYDEPPKEIPKTVKKGAKSSAKRLTKKKTQPDESDPNSFDVETEMDLEEWYRENEIFHKWWEVGQCIMWLDPKLT